jgi:RNA 2',3'-cyclic 3'-phosphodiesterase
METKRLFIGSHIDLNVFNDKYADIKNNFKAASFGKWVELENLHFTYKFLGDVEIDKIEELKSSLDDQLQNFESQIEFKGLGVFPNMQKARVLFVNLINRDGMIKILNSQIENICCKLGFTPENKPFKAHMTLMRIKDINIEKFKPIVDGYADTSFGTMSSFQINLIESCLFPSGPVYKVLT